MSAKQLSTVLAALVDDYQLGLPRGAIPAQPELHQTRKDLCWQGRSPIFALVVDSFSDQEISAETLFTGPQGELARALVEKGLKLSLDSVVYMNCKTFLAFSNTIDANSLRVIIFGQQALRELHQHGHLENISISTGTVFSLSGFKALATVSLRAVCEQPQLKRVLWMDVQKIL